MSCDVKAFGTLQFDSKDALEEANAILQDDDEDESVAEAREVVERGTSVKRNVLTLNIDASLSNEANVWFQEWLTDVAEAASEGYVDTWQESFGESMFVRTHAGGEDEQMDEPFASRS